MSDHWYYADKERPVGPFSLRELKNVLQGLPNWKEALIWREGYGAWRKAASIIDLDHFEATPPPVPRTQTSPGQGPNERTASSERPTGLSRKTIFLVVSFYFAAALSLAVFMEMRKPFATWAKLSDAVPLGRVIGAAFTLFLVSGVIPNVVWAFRRFRAEKASGPLYIWLLLLAGLGFLVAYGQSKDLDYQLGQFGKTLLTEKNSRQEFIVGARGSCIRTQRQDLLNSQVGVTDAQIAAFCDCYANRLATHLTPDEIVYYGKFGKPSATAQQKINDVKMTCIRTAVVPRETN